MKFSASIRMLQDCFEPLSACVIRLRHFQPRVCGHAFFLGAFSICFLGFLFSQDDLDALDD